MHSFMCARLNVCVRACACVRACSQDAKQNLGSIAAQLGKEDNLAQVGLGGPVGGGGGSGGGAVAGMW